MQSAFVRLFHLKTAHLSCRVQNLRRSKQSVEGKFHFKFSQREIATGQMIEYVVGLESSTMTREPHPHRLFLAPDPPAKCTRTGN